MIVPAMALALNPTLEIPACPSFTSLTICWIRFAYWPLLKNELKLLRLVFSYELFGPSNSSPTTTPFALTEPRFFFVFVSSKSSRKLMSHHKYVQYFHSRHNWHLDCIWSFLAWFLMLILHAFEYFRHISMSDLYPLLFDFQAFDWICLGLLP